jgi:formate hydrogenlyase subunit 3/multisubunit Na+/H+ antiporter MnhD subunit
MMGTQTLVFIFFSLCGVGILLSLTAPALRRGSVLTWFGCLASITLLLSGASALWGDGTFRQPLWSLPGLATLTLALDRLSAAFLFVTGLVFFPASIFAGGELRRNRISKMRAGSPCCCSGYLRPSL